MSKMLPLPRLVVLLLVAALLVSGIAAPPASGHSPTRSSYSPRWIIRLEEPPVAQAPQARPGYTTMSLDAAGASAQGRLQVDRPEAQQYRAFLQERQARVAQAVRQVFPAARVQRTYQVVLNGLSVVLPGADEAVIDHLRALPGVAGVYPEQGRELTMFSSLPLMHTETLWNHPSIGGQGNAGAGIKVAVIDTGIEVRHPFFDPQGYQYPPGYPKGDTAHTTPKVIVARAYFRPDMPPLEGSETPAPGPKDGSHGTHVAGTVAGVANTIANAYGVEQTISGVAPRAFLMNYKVFYGNDSVFSGMAFETELIAALEDAVTDGADIINNSWGSRANLDPHFDPISIAANAAADAGVVVVFSAGNSGPSKSTVDSRDFTDKLIIVGASTTARTIAAGFVDVTAPGEVPESLKGAAYGGADFGPPIRGAAFGPAPYRPIAALGGSSLGCDPLPEGSLNGQIALVERGVCLFSLKALHVQQAGATAMLVYNHEQGGDTILQMGGGEGAEAVTIPSVIVSHRMGLGLIDWYHQYGDAARVQIDPQGRVIDITPDVMAPFSSRGPTFQGNLKPDVVAPGVNILSAGYAAGAEGSESHMGFGLASGTSMAAPHVSGAVALLRQTHPEWSPLDIRSALISTASPDVWLDDDRTQPAGVLERGGGRVDLGRVGSPDLLFNPPSLSFGSLATATGQPTRAEVTVTARNISGQSQTYRLNAGPPETASLAVQVSPAQVTVRAGESARFTVAIELPADAAPGDYGGSVELQGSQTLRLPIWVRALPAEPGNKVLLVDNDGSSSLDLPDYAAYYRTALNELAVPFTYLDVDALAPRTQTLPDISELQQHEIILWFTGDNHVPSGSLPVPTPLTEADQNVLIAYLQGGGSLIATGQNLAEASDVEDVPPGDEYGRSDLYKYYLGGRFVQENVFENTGDGSRGVVGLTAQPWLASISLDLSNPMAGGVETNLQSAAGNQDSVDEVVVIDEDPRSPDLYTTPIFKAASPLSLAEGIVGLNRASSPTLEEPAPAFSYRASYLAFGLEGVRNDTGFTTQKELLQALLYWHVDRPTVQLDRPVVAEGSDGLVTLTAHAQSNIPASFGRYRWDFGDGSPILETEQATVVHRYQQPGSYDVRVEVTDSWGHRALSSSTAPAGQQPMLASPRPADTGAGTGAGAGSVSSSGSGSVPALSRPAVVGTTALTFPETGHTLQGRFLDFWQRYGGVAVFGFPLTEQTTGAAPGRSQVQVFERSRFEYHPEHAPPYDIVLGHLGVEALQAQGRDWRSFPTVGGPPSPDCRYFAETAHSLCGPFKAFWERHGLEFDGRPGFSFAESLALSGLPLSEPHEETIDGTPLTVQWFERARFEYHSDTDSASARAAPMVLLGRLGSETSSVNSVNDEEGGKGNGD
ncbi:MAG: S8 family serine peptidase [Chloroflexaceae bacterium]|nr:S8 family serine peptidase [Chloroflexaceae bacterium]